MFTKLTLTLGLLCVLAFTNPALAQTADNRTGVVVSAVLNQLVVTEDQSGAKKTYEIGPDAVVSLNGKPATLADLTMGDMVKINLETTDGKTVVTAVEAKSAEQKGSAA